MAELRLDDNVMGNIGAKALCDMLATKDTMPELKVLTLNANNISEDMYEKLNATEG